MAEPVKPEGGSPRSVILPVGGALPWVAPMMAKLVAGAPEGTWEYEIKFDGFRGLAFKNHDEVTLLSRTKQDMSPKFPDIVEALRQIPAAQAVLDGELVALDREGRSSFQLLQALEQHEEPPPIFYYLFDLLQLNGKRLTDEPLEERKAKLAKLIGKTKGPLRFSPSLGRNAQTLLAMTRVHRLEGLIGKRAESLYESGKRSGSWIKLRQVTEQEFVIGGYTKPAGSRPHFGALLVGYYAAGKLHYAGKVGTGFTATQLATLLKEMAPLGQSKCPFAGLPERSTGRFGQGITAPVMRQCHWIKPRMVTQVKFAEWTKDGRLRHPVYLGIRKDKPARSVRWELPVTT